MFINTGSPEVTVDHPKAILSPIESLTPAPQEVLSDERPSPTNLNQLLTDRFYAYGVPVEGVTESDSDGEENRCEIHCVTM